MSLQRQLILLIFMAVVFAGLLAFRVVPEVAGWTAEAAPAPDAPPPGPKLLVVPWTPPGTALEGSFEARVARRPEAPETEEVPDER